MPSAGMPSAGMLGPLSQSPVGNGSLYPQWAIPEYAWARLPYVAYPAHSMQIGVNPAQGVIPASLHRAPSVGLPLPGNVTGQGPFNATPGLQSAPLPTGG